jgi:hypothetical protein
MRFFIDFDDDDTTPTVAGSGSGTTGPPPAPAKPSSANSTQLETYWKPLIEQAINSELSKDFTKSSSSFDSVKIILNVANTSQADTDSKAFTAKLISGDNISSLIADSIDANAKDASGAGVTSLTSKSEIDKVFADASNVLIINALFKQFIEDKFDTSITPTPDVKDVFKKALESVLLKSTVYTELNKLPAIASLEMYPDGGRRRKFRRSDGRKKRSHGKKKRSDGRRGKGRRKSPK